jgi:hypothetical protein
MNDNLLNPLDDSAHYVAHKKRMLLHELEKQREKGKKDF